MLNAPALVEDTIRIIRYIARGIDTCNLSFQKFIHNGSVLDAQAVLKRVCRGADSNSGHDQVTCDLLSIAQFCSLYRASAIQRSHASIFDDVHTARRIVVVEESRDLRAEYAAADAV